jgi:DNA-binding transcriptional MocR family regulator
VPPSYPTKRVSVPWKRPEWLLSEVRQQYLLNEKYKTFVGPGYWFEQDRRSMRIGYGWPQPSELSEGLENISRALREAAGAI